MISEVLGLLFGQIAVLSMERFFMAMPREWIRKYVHQSIRRFLRCDDISVNAVYGNRTQSGSIPSPTWQQCQRMQIIIDSINEALIKLHNYDKQLIRFEETFVGSTIILIIIAGILLTVLLWLRRLSCVLPHGFPQNYKGYQREHYSLKPKDIPQEVPVLKSSTSMKDNLDEGLEKPIEKSQNSSSIGASNMKSKISVPDNSSNPYTSVGKDNLGEETKKSQSKLSVETSNLKSGISLIDNSINSYISVEKAMSNSNGFETAPFNQNVLFFLNFHS
ncbi:unnamed protein product [Onchocerca ochengi]|uniref:Chloride channel CLIC-like protein 1 n=1 Tax=Onchocerca ochengi TaxID=42157 RepID=A0A182E3Y6_ONCOC|nr:unnamed protein product [Onchocerca ochengi]